METTGGTISNEAVQSNLSCRDAALKQYREFIAKNPNSFNLDTRANRGFDAGLVPRELYDTGVSDIHGQRIYETRELKPRSIRTPGRDLIGGNYSLQGTIDGLELSNFPPACQENEDDQLILYLRATELNNRIIELSSVASFSELSQSKLMALRSLFDEQTRLYGKAATPAHANANAADCASDGPPLDYYCSAGLPEAHLFLVYGRERARIKPFTCDNEFVQHWEMASQANLVNFRERALQSLTNFSCPQLEQLIGRR